VAANDPDRTEPATPKRRREAREEGQVARSPEVLTAFVLGAGLLALWVGARHMFAELAALCDYLLRIGAEWDATPQGVGVLAIRVMGGLVRALFPVLLAGILGGVAGNVVQVGFFISFQAVAPNPERLSPAAGLRNLFTRQKLIDLLKNLLKVVAVGWVAFLTVRGRMGEVVFLSDLVPRTLLAYLLGLGFDILRNVLWVYLVIALADYAFQRWEYEQKLRMTKQEVKEEFRETEGDPLIRSRIRSIQRELARRRMMAEVPRSDVVITNPTHYAIALRYRPDEMDAPLVTARGADQVAEKIVSLAREHSIPLYESPAVARALFRQTEVGDPIPADLFQAVAEILAYVYRLRPTFTEA
jgi:flagellar biosynthetic protein FlhB